MAVIGIIDCDLGNLTSVSNAFSAIGVETVRVREPNSLSDVSHIVLPGVGSFQAGMAKLNESGIGEGVVKSVEAGVPVLGICLGMQLLALEGDEFVPTRGIGAIPGQVTRLTPTPTELRLPHVGWNDVRYVSSSMLFKGLEESPNFYFVHSYGYNDPTADYVSAVAEYGGAIVASVEKDNVFGVQFHPEKSQKNGLTVLENFARIC